MKSNTLKTTMLFGMMALFGVMTIQAQSSERGERKGPPAFSQLLEKMDADKDGKLAKDEVKGKLSERFDTIDTDEDGFITEEEFEKAPKPKGRKPANK